MGTTWFKYLLLHNEYNSSKIKMAMQDKVVVNGIDVTDSRISWYFSGTWGNSIDAVSIELSASVSSLISIETGLEITITRGFTTSEDETVFIGQIIQVKPSPTTITLVCKNRMIDAVKSAQTKSWDIDIDTESGIGSEIFKDICDNSSLNYTPAKGIHTDGSIVNTGTTIANKIVKFIQNDEDDFQKMNELAEHFNYMIDYDYENELVNFLPKGYTNYPVSITVGQEIPAQIKWKENMEQLINKVKIQGATVYDKMVEEFAPAATIFQLAKTPEDSEVRINSTTTNDLQVRGQKDVGTLGVDFDYYIDVEQKKIVFATDVSNVWINYGAQVPLPIVLTNSTSVEKYGGPNKKPHFKKFAFNDIKDPKDAEDRGRAILNKYSLPFNEAEKVPVIDSIIETNGPFNPGDLVQIIDPYTGKELSLFVTEINKSWPHIQDTISVGDEAWKTEDWQAKQMEKINRLFNELNKNQDILIQTFDVERSTELERRYMYLEASNVVGTSGIYGHPLYGIYGTSTYGSTTGGTCVLGHPTFGRLGVAELGAGTSAKIVVRLQQGNNEYQEYLYDNDFYSDDSTATLNTTTKEVTFTADQFMITEKLTLGVSYSFITVHIPAITGDVLIEFSGNNGVDWQTVTLGIRTPITVADNLGTLFRITENNSSTAKIENTYEDGSGNYDEPAIKIKFEE